MTYATCYRVGYRSSVTKCQNDISTANTADHSRQRADAPRRPFDDCTPPRPRAEWWGALDAVNKRILLGNGPKTFGKLRH